jgi:hypothetical protein
MTSDNKYLPILKIVIPIIIILAIFSGAVALEVIKFEKPAVINSEEITATVIIDFGEGIPELYEISTINNTVYGFLLEVSHQEGYDIKTTYYASFDSLLIDSISNYEGGQDNKYWMFYLNDEFCSVSADKQIVETGDTIEWKFEESQF